MIRPLFPLLLGCLLVLLCSAPAHAVLIAADDFIIGGGSAPYVHDTTPANRGGTNTTGFTGTWTNQTTSYYRTVNTNLSIPGYASTGGGSFRFGPNGDGNFSRSISRAFTPTSAAQTTMWFSTLFRPSTLAFDAGRESMIQFLSGGSSATVGANNVFNGNSTTYDALWGGQTGSTSGNALDGFGFGISTFGSNGNNTPAPGSAPTSGLFSVKYQSGTDTVTLASTGFTMTQDQTYLILAKLNLNVSGASDTLDLWVVTSLPTSEATLGAPTFSLSAASGIDLVSTANALSNVVVSNGVLSDGGLSVTFNYFDALRIGTTFSDVTAVPEPTRALLLGLAIGLLALRRQRRITA